MMKPLSLLAAALVLHAHGQTIVPLLHYNDLHAHLTPHKDLVRLGDPCANDQDAQYVIGERGGIARLKHMVEQIRANHPSSILMCIGDTYHGGVEAAYTQGNAIVGPVNALGIDVAVPGNWDFGYGPGVFRKRYTPTGPFPTMLNAMLPSFPIEPVAYPVIAANLFYQDITPFDPSPDGQLVLPPARIIVRQGIKLGFVGITSDIVPKMYEQLARGFSFTQGETAYATLITQQAQTLRNQGCAFVAVLSELGIHKDYRLSQLVQPGLVDVIFSAHTHEATQEPLQANPDAPLVVEAGNDGWLGRMDASFDADGLLTGLDWQLIPIDGQVPEHPAMAALVSQARAPFLTANPGFSDPMGTSSQELHSPITNAVGAVDGLLTRIGTLESSFNKTFCRLMMEHAGTQASITPGFRFDSPIAGPGMLYEDGAVAIGEVTVEDLYRFFPVFYTLSTAECRGDSLRRVIEDLLTSVYSTDAFAQEGGWVDGFGGIQATIDLNGPDGSRVISLARADGTIINGSDVLTVAGCERPLEATNVLCSHTGFMNKAALLNSQTNQAFTAVQLLEAAFLAENPLAVSTASTFTDISGQPAWPAHPFMQPLPTAACAESPTGFVAHAPHQRPVLQPNPADGHTILNGLPEDMEVTVLDANGAMVRSWRTASPVIRIETGMLPSGLYAVRWQGEGINGAMRLMVMH